MKKKQNKVSTYIKEHKSDIIDYTVGAVIGCVVAAGVTTVYYKKEYGELYKAMRIFGRGSKTNCSLATGITKFLNEANCIQKLAPDTTITIADLGSDIVETLVKECGYDPTTKVSGLLIGLNK